MVLTTAQPVGDVGRNDEGTADRSRRCSICPGTRRDVRGNGSLLQRGAHPEQHAARQASSLVAAVEVGSLFRLLITLPSVERHNVSSVRPEGRNLLKATTRATAARL
jgi:hypothetical protein